MALNHLHKKHPSKPFIIFAEIFFV